ncbi:MAG TPA: cytochrome b N-terminal domain-containing protein [Kofleriaceae bacterium]|nr:cytochrome b N-terminal domain-containing protein [Kofleriaceae bacterium]
MGRVADWLDERTGYRGALKVALEEPVPGGASFVYTFGSVLSFILVLQITTGIFLAMYYSPSATDAWASVAYIQDQVTLGWFVRGLHSHGASAMVIIAGLHLLQTAVWGAYKKPREVNWILGCLMLALILAFALTGYLLPWDQTGYWATKVATGIAGSSPGIGEPLQSAAQGGNEYGNLTLTRFFAIHVFVLPAAMLGLVALHVALFRKHGVTPKWGQSPEQLRERSQPFWPDQLFKDMVAIAVVFAGIAAWTVWTGGVSLDAPADPSSNFDARPEWYFRPLFQALKYFHGPMEMVVALGLPVVIGGILIGLPFVDRGPSRDPQRRKRFLLVLFAMFGIAGLLTFLSFREDANDGDLQERLALSEARGHEARALARAYGVPPAGGAAVFTMKPDTSARAVYASTGPIQGATIELWTEHCARCHEGEKRSAPEIAGGYNSRRWIRSFLIDPSGDLFFGRVESIQAMKTPMPSITEDELEPVEVDAIVELVYSLSGAADADAAMVARGVELFEEGSCSNCHDLEPGEKLGSAPNLVGRGSAKVLQAFIADPDDPLWFGALNEMPAFGDKLTELEVSALVDYLLWLRTQ